MSEVIRFPIIGDWGGYDGIIFPNGYVPTQIFGAKRYKIYEKFRKNPVVSFVCAKKSYTCGKNYVKVWNENVKMMVVILLLVLEIIFIPTELWTQMTRDFRQVLKYIIRPCPKTNGQKD